MMLDTILAHKREEIARLDLPALKRRAADARPPRDFLTPLPGSATPPPAPVPTAQERGEGAGGWGVRLIAEIKFASPSRGVLRSNVDPVDLARIYEANGAAGLSVLTDERFFHGSLDIFARARASCHLPMLRKDFILSAAQVYESRAAGADAILLIVAAIPDNAELADLHALAIDTGLAPLVEVHTPTELERALRLEPTLIGINNRDLRTFEVSLETTAALRPLIPPGIGVVSESGIFTPDHVARLTELGVDAMLVGEALVTAPDIGAKVRELTSLSPVGTATTGDAKRPGGEA